MQRFGTAAVAVAIGAIVSTASTLAVPAIYDFSIKPLRSGLAADIGLDFTTSGTLIGNYNADTNPDGTRTKPGIFGSFGSTENLPVAISLGVGLGNDVSTQTSGGYRLIVDVDAGVVVIQNYSVNLLSDGPAALTASIGLETEAFRTRNPTSIYPGGIPIELPVGQVSLEMLTAQQIGVAAPGVLTPTGPNTYSFVVAPLVNLAASASVLDMPFDLPPTPVPFPLTGELVLSGDTATVTSLQPLEFAQELDPNVALPQQAFALPTILPPGGEANVLLDLTLDGITAAISGEIRAEANGVLVPEPGSLVGLVLLAVCVGRRSQR